MIEHIRNFIQDNKKRTLQGFILIIALILVVMAIALVRPGNKDLAEAIEIKPQDYSETILAAGQLQLARETAIVSEVSGRVRYIGTEEGGTISAGAVLIAIEDTEQAYARDQKKAEYLNAGAQYDQILEVDYLAAVEDLKRQTVSKEQAYDAYQDAISLYNEGAISQNALKESEVSYQSASAQWNSSNLKMKSFGPGGSARESAMSRLQSAEAVYQNAQQTLSKYQIVAPWNSILLKSYAEAGDYVRPGDVLADIGEEGSAEVTTELDEKYFPYIKKGMEALISIGTDSPQEEMEGVVKTITPKINEGTGTFNVTISLPEEFPYQVSDLTVNIEIKLKEANDAILIPAQYVIDSEKPSVFLYKNGRLELKEITVENGPSSKILVTKGLSSGDVIVKPQGDMKDGDSVKVNKGDEAS